MRLGVSVFGTTQDIDNVINGDENLLSKLLREGKFEIDGDTYIPDTSIEIYNQINGTQYDETAVEFDLNIKSVELHHKGILGHLTTSHLWKNEVLVRMCPDTKSPVLICHNGDGESLCLHNETKEDDLRAVENWLATNGEVLNPEIDEPQSLCQQTKAGDADGDTLESILDDSNKCERFAEIVLEEIRSDEEQLRHIGSNIIKAYLNGDCDNLLIALCGWSMDTLLKKFQQSHVKYYTCPACYEEALKYAMIDVDGTNLEEGYSCGECGECFIGLDNQEVIEQNPEIQQENE